MAERFDLDAIAADDALLDRLAAGGEALYDALDAGGDDPAVRMLGELRLAVEVVEDERPGSPDDELERILAQGAGKGSGADPLARKIATRTLALGVAAVAGLSVSGVAAAVTGDPLSPYEKVIEKVVDGLRPQSTFPIKSVGGVVSSKSASRNAVKEYKQAVKDNGDQTSPVEQDKTDDTTTALTDFLGRDRNRIEPDLPPLVKKEPTFTDPGGKDKVTQPLEREPADTSTDDNSSEPTEPKVEPTQEPTAEPTTEPSKPVEPITSEPTQEPTTPPTTTEPTQPPATTEPSPTPTSATTGGETNQPNSGGETNTGTGDVGGGEQSTGGKTDGQTDSNADSGSSGSTETQSPEEKPVDKPSDPPSLPPSLPPSIQPSLPSEPDNSDRSQKPSDESSVPGTGSDRPGNSDHAKQLDRLNQLPAAPLDNEFVLRLIATLNGVMAPR